MQKQMQNDSFNPIEKPFLWKPVETALEDWFVASTHASTSIRKPIYDRAGNQGYHTPV